MSSRLLLPSGFPRGGGTLTWKLVPNPRQLRDDHGFDEPAGRHRLVPKAHLCPLPRLGQQRVPHLGPRPASERVVRHLPLHHQHAPRHVPAHRGHGRARTAQGAVRPPALFAPQVLLRVQQLEVLDQSDQRPETAARTAVVDRLGRPTTRLAASTTTSRSAAKVCGAARAPSECRDRHRGAAPRARRVRAEAGRAGRAARAGSAPRQGGAGAPGARVCRAAAVAGSAGAGGPGAAREAVEGAAAARDEPGEDCGTRARDFGLARPVGARPDDARAVRCRELPLFMPCYFRRVSDQKR